MPSRSYARRTKLPGVKPKKPYRLKRWKVDTPKGVSHFFTCARPGRSACERSKIAKVSDAAVHSWVLGLSEHCGSSIAIVSLLGQKKDAKGTSEFSFYSFCGGFDDCSERKNRLTFEEWLNCHHKGLGIVVKEHPTYDFGKKNTFPPGTQEAVKSDIEELLSTGRTVVVMDSGGETRTGMVSAYLGAKEDSSRITR